VERCSDACVRKVALHRILHLFLVGVAVLASGGAAAQSGVVSIAASVLSKSNCKFDNTTGTLAFGSLDPASSGVVTASTTIGFKCGGSAPNATFSITHDSGLYETAPNANRMKHATLNEYLSYGVGLSPSSATVPKNSQQTLTITGTVPEAAYQNAHWGAYTDSVVVTIQP